MVSSSMPGGIDNPPILYLSRLFSTTPCKDIHQAGVRPRGSVKNRSAHYTVPGHLWQNLKPASKRNARPYRMLLSWKVLRRLKNQPMSGFQAVFERRHCLAADCAFLLPRSPA